MGRVVLGATVALVSWLVLALGCGDDDERAPCGGPDTCPSGFSCQDRGGGYRCFNEDGEEPGEVDGEGGSGKSSPKPGEDSVNSVDGKRDSGTGGERDAATNAGSGGSAAGVTGKDGGPSQGGGGGGGSSVPPGVCSTPYVLFVIDGSGSMCESFDGSTRWAALRASLLDPNDGLLYRWQDSAALGVVLFDGTIDLVLALSATGSTPAPACAAMYTEMRMTGECAHVIVVSPALRGAATIDGLFPMTELGGSTPTDKAMNAAVTALSPENTGGQQPRVLVLVTDGLANDICVGGAGGDGAAQQAAVLAAVDRAAVEGITTYVVNMSAADAALTAHLDTVAQHGNPTDPAARPYSPTTADELRTALERVMNAASGCKDP